MHEKKQPETNFKAHRIYLKMIKIFDLRHQMIKLSNGHKVPKEVQI